MSAGRGLTPEPRALALHGPASADPIAAVALRIRRDLEAEGRPAGDFDPARYFRPSVPLAFLNVRMPVVRAVARGVARAQRERWSFAQALACADLLMHDPCLEVKAAGIESLAIRRRELRPSSLRTFKRWLSRDLAANWATTDLLCGALITPLLLDRPDLVPEVAVWVTHRNLWVRRAAAVSLVRLAARGMALDAAYAVATALRPDAHDLIHKAAGWLLRECGRTDRPRLERYLRTVGAALPRTTLRYAIERFPKSRRAALLRATHPPGRRMARRRVVPADPD